MRGDIFHLDAFPSGFEEFRFSAPGWHHFTKPRGAKLLWFCVISSGAGGGGGFTRASGVQGGGGGGGSGAGIPAFTLIPAAFVPDILSIYVGKGGEGGAANTAGSPGESSFITTVPGVTQTVVNTSNGFTLMFTLRNPTSSQGQPGTGAAGGAGGNDGTPSGAVLVNRGIATNTGGASSGTNGGASSDGVSSALNNASSVPVFTGGTGGGGVTTGDVAGRGGTFLINGASHMSVYGNPINPISNAGGGDGMPGFCMGSSTFPYIYVGGGGGGANGTGAGGNGGQGALGCGGGGGGAGTTGGRGGDGGHGLVIIGVL